jgi:hypothetical protein
MVILTEAKERVSATAALSRSGHWRHMRPSGRGRAAGRARLGASWAGSAFSS